jgi:hypothetical protein
MTKPRPISYSTTAMKTPICKALLACDGDNLVGGARDRGYCGKCSAFAKKHGKQLPVKGDK